MRFDDYERHGDYLIPSDIMEEAEREFAKRGPRSRAMDRALRGSITTDFEKWKRLKGRGVDFPGVDTPRESPPTMAAIDHIGIHERARVAAGQPRPAENDVILAEDPAVRRRGPSVTDTIGRVGTAMWNASGEAANIIRPGSVQPE